MNPEFLFFLPREFTVTSEERGTIPSLAMESHLMIASVKVHYVKAQRETQHYGVHLLAWTVDRQSKIVDYDHVGGMPLFIRFSCDRE